MGCTLTSLAMPTPQAQILWAKSLFLWLWLLRGWTVLLIANDVSANPKMSLKYVLESAKCQRRKKKKVESVPTPR